MFSTEVAASALADLCAATEAIKSGEVAAVRAMLALADSYHVDELAAEDAAAALNERRARAQSTREQNLRWLCLEVGAALGLSPASAGYRVAQALALRDRHPQLWTAVQAGRLRVWQSREVMVRCAQLHDQACQQVDQQVARWCGQLPWARLLRAVEAAVLAADPRGARERRQVDQDRRYVQVGRISDGHVDVVGRLGAGDGIALDQALDGIADAYLDPNSPWHRSVVSVQQARAVALGELARTALGQDTLLVAGLADNEEPQTSTASPAHFSPGCAGAPPRREQLKDVLRDEARELHRHHHLAGPPRDPARPDASARGISPSAFANPARPRPSIAPRSWQLPPMTRTATLVVHISDRTLASPDGLARVVGWGPVLRDHVADLLAGMKVTVRPVIDPGAFTPADSYEIPERVRFAVSQRTPVDVFPYSLKPAERCDLDHTVPWPRGDTHPNNLGPLSRTAHMAKTLKLWRLEQPAPGVFVWESPLRQRYLVTAQGTLRLPETATVVAAPQSVCGQLAPPQPHNSGA